MTAPIRTPDQRLRVFVSSTLQEMAAERAVCKEAIERLRLTPVLFELGARAHPPRDLYRAYLAQSDIFIGLYWQRYGWVAPSETISGLEDEYRLAQPLPKLIYIKRADTREDQLKALIHRIQDEDNVSYRPFSEAAELLELIEDDLALMLTERFAAAGSAAVTAASLAPTLEAPPLSQAPVERGALIGRESLVARVTELLRRADSGLITLTGPGGTGKTRLAIHLANTLGPEFVDGAFYVPLAGVRQAREVAPTLVSTLEILAPATGEDPQRLLLGFLRARRTLLVLDNFEQVLAAADDVRQLLAACPHLKVLATSREPLRIRGEREVPVPPLPHAFQVGGVNTPAMLLFEERAREVRPDFAIDDDNRLAVAELCRRLDALPLAIELAAARVRVLSPQAMLPRLNQSLALLTGGQRDLPERHRTLRAALEWSLDLLRPEERLFFRRLGVFAGSFSEEAAAAVVAEDAGMEALDGLSSLVEKSLLVRAEVRGESRFHLLETVRELARERLAEAGEERAARLRHGQWVVEFLASEHVNLNRVPTRRAAIERIAAEEAGARQALRFAASAEGEPELAWQLFIRLGFALENGSARTADVLADYALLQPLPRSADPVRAALALGNWAYGRASMADPAAETDLAAACAVLEAAGEREYLPTLLTSWGTLLSMSDLPRALVILERALRLARDTNQTAIEGWTLQTICYGHIHAGAVDEAEQHADALASFARRWHDEEFLALAHAASARVKLARGDLAGARSLFAEAVSLARSRNSAWPRCIALCGLASVTLAAGDEADARAIIEEAIHFVAGVGFVSLDALCGALALQLAKSGQPERALRVFAATAPGTEDDAGYNATMSDPSGALRAATRAARALLGNPPPLDPAAVDLDAVLQAALTGG